MCNYLQKSVRYRKKIILMSISSSLDVQKHQIRYQDVMFLPFLITSTPYLVRKAEMVLGTHTISINSHCKG